MFSGEINKIRMKKFLNPGGSKNESFFMLERSIKTNGLDKVGNLSSLHFRDSKKKNSKVSQMNH